MRPHRPFLAPSAAPAAALLLVLATGCASTPEGAMPVADYAASLGPWKGQPESALVARWGPPTAVEEGAAGRFVVYVGIGGFGFGGGGRTAVGGGVGVAVPLGGPSANAACVTRFQIEGGVVSGWTAEGAACRAAPGPG